MAIEKEFGSFNMRSVCLQKVSYALVLLVLFQAKEGESVPIRNFQKNLEVQKKTSFKLLTLKEFRGFPKNIYPSSIRLLDKLHLVGAIEQKNGGDPAIFTFNVKTKAFTVFPVPTKEPDLKAPFLSVLGSVPGNKHLLLIARSSRWNKQIWIGIYDTQTKEVLLNKKLPFLSGYPSKVQLSKDKAFLAATGDEGVHVYKLPKLDTNKPIQTEQVVSKYGEHLVEPIKLSTKSSQSLTVGFGQDSKALFWGTTVDKDGRNPHIKKTFLTTEDVTKIRTYAIPSHLEEHGEPGSNVVQIAHQPNEAKWLACALVYRKVLVFDTRTKALGGILEVSALPSGEHYNTRLTFTPDGTHIAVAYTKGKEAMIDIFEAESKKKKLTLSTGQRKMIEQVAAFQFGSKVLLTSASRDGSLNIYEFRYAYKVK